MYRSRLLLALGALVFLLLSLIVVTGSLIPRNVAHVQAASSSNDWTTYLYDQGRSGYNPGETAITPSTAPNLKLLWSAKSSTVISTQPVIANGLVYWGDWGGSMHASKPDGTLVWTTNLGQMPTPSTCSGRTHGILGTATAVTVTINGTATPVLFASGGTSVLYALNALSGTVLWQKQLASSPYDIWGSVGFYDNSVYIGLLAWGDCPLVQAKFLKVDGITGDHPEYLQCCSQWLHRCIRLGLGDHRYQQRHTVFRYWQWW
jgi:polyvinyl alcohol dehydrogenase (cytochrome)